MSTERMSADTVAAILTPYQYSPALAAPPPPPRTASLAKDDSDDWLTTDDSDDGGDGALEALKSAKFKVFRKSFLKNVPQTFYST